MAYTSYITVKNQFVGTHKWGNCPHEDVAFLKNEHRHVFHVQTVLPVNHDDRDLEFFMVQNEIDKTIYDLYDGNTVHLELGNRSCEMVAKEIIDGLRKTYDNLPWIRVSVSEDDENSAGVMWEKD